MVVQVKGQGGVEVVRVVWFRKYFQSKCNRIHCLSLKS